MPPLLRAEEAAEMKSSLLLELVSLVSPPLLVVGRRLKYVGAV